MRRREFIAGIGGAATSYLSPRAAEAQQPQKQHRIAFVHSGIPADQLTETAGPFWVRRFYETLRGLGHTEGANLIVERHSAEGRFERFAALAAAVVSSKPDVVLVN
jgi:putative tryptophan/tyrosine transport system substrate-binding protein